MTIRLFGLDKNAKNTIINGRFDVSQRGASFSFPSATINKISYTLDRWEFTTIAGGGTTAAVIVSRQNHNAGETITNSPNYIKIANSNVGAANTNSASYLLQKIENVKIFAGRVVTFSFYAKSTYAKQIVIECAQVFGTGGSPSAAIGGIGLFTINIPGTNVWTKFTNTFTIPSISGKTIGTDGYHTSFLQVAFWLQAGTATDLYTRNGGVVINWESTGSIDISDVQLEVGSVANPIEPLTEGETLFKCQRYYNILLASLRFISSAAGYPNGTEVFFPYMRVPPSINLIAPGGRNLISSVALYDIYNSAARLEIVSSSAGDCYVVSEYYALSAEL